MDDATFIVADDEDNTFRLYRCDRPGLPAESIPWDAHLGIDPETDEHPEADIEGAAMLGDHVYWISSHGRNKDGKWRPNRHRFFAITVTRDGKGTRVEPFGKPVDNLATKLVADRRLRRFKLDAALRPDQDRAKELAPKREGFNIEGLSAMADGRSLLLGLRNPRPNGKALLIPLVQSRGRRPRGRRRPSSATRSSWTCDSSMTARRARWGFVASSTRGTPRAT